MMSNPNLVNLKYMMVLELKGKLNWSEFF